jgi:hypothetical protein
MIAPGMEIDSARTLLAARMLTDPNTEWTHLFMMDDDSVVGPETLVAMIEADKDCICGVGFKKDLKAEPAVWCFEDPDKLNLGFLPCPVPECMNADTSGTPKVGCWQCHGSGKVSKPPYPVAASGFAAVLIKRACLAGTWEHIKQVENNHESMLFRHHESGASEDAYFCNMAREAGFKVWVHPGIEVTHIDFDGNIWNYDDIGRNCYNIPPEMAAEIRMYSAERHGLLPPKIDRAADIVPACFTPGPNNADVQLAAAARRKMFK